MKRIVTVCIIALTAIGAASAQGMGAGPGMIGPAGIQAQYQVPQIKSTIEGKLALVQGHPALTVKDKTYYIRLPQYLYGFIDGLKEGATVKLEGFEAAIPYAPNGYFFSVSTLTLGGKSYDISLATNGMMGGRGMRGGLDGSTRGGAGRRGW